MTAPLFHARRNSCASSAWRAARAAEARAVLADVAHHPDTLLRLAGCVLAVHGETPRERAEGRALRALIDARPQQGRRRLKRSGNASPAASQAQEARP